MDHTARNIYLARDVDGALYLYSEKPRISFVGYWFGDGYMLLPEEDYPEVTYENSPVRVESFNLRIERKENNSYVKIRVRRKNRPRFNRR